MSVTEHAPAIIAVLRAEHASAYGPVVRTLVDNGIGGIELTMSTPGTFDQFEHVRSEAPEGAQIGLGTVTTVEQVWRADALEVDFIVTPTTDSGVIAAAVEAGIPIYPGGLTPTELWSGWSAGATAVKIFPASLFGPEYLAHLRGPFPDIEVVPSGGVGLAEAEAWIRAGASSVSVGGPLLGDALRGGDLGALAARCAQFVDAVNKGRSAR